MADDLGELLVPSGGWIVVADHNAAGKVERGLGSIAVEFEPFRLPAAVAEEWDEDPEASVETPLRLDFITWPLPGPESTTLSDLAGVAFDFPVNPEDGYIDASVYLLDQHCQADVTRIEFGQISDASAIEATLTVHIDADGTGFDDVDARFAALLIERTKKPY